MEADKTILMVDDSTDDAELMQASVKESSTPCLLKSVASADEAFSYLQGKGQYSNRSRYPFPSLMLLDIQMPGKNGFAVLEWVRSQKTEWRRLPIIMLTTSHAYDDIKRGYDLGANSFLVKPTGFIELRKMVADLLAYWLPHNRTLPLE